MQIVSALWILFFLPYIYGNLLMFNYGEAGGDQELTQRQKNSVAHLTLNPPILFFDQQNSEIYIDSNGVIWPGWYCGYACDQPTTFPVEDGSQVVACYWADTELSANPNSHVYYRVVTDFSTMLTANSLIRKAYGPTVNFDITSNKTVIVVATWVNVTYPGGNEAETNTFQCAILSDGNNSYALFSYAQLQWANSPVEMASNNPAIAGVDSGFGDQAYNSYSLPLSHVTNVVDLVNGGNFVQQGTANGWYTVSMAKQYIPFSYNLTGVGYKTCISQSDPHYTTFDGLVVDKSFPNNPGPYVTQMQATGNWIMFATSDCKPSNYPPIALFAIVDTCSSPSPCPTCPQCPKGFKLELFFDTVGIGEANTKVEIEVFADHFTVGGHTYTASYSCPASLCTSQFNNYTFYIDPISNTGYSLTSNFGLSVQFTSDASNPKYGYVSVTLPLIDALFQNIFGYCGNMDGVQNNDNYCWDPAMHNWQNYQNCWPESYLVNATTDFGDGIYQCQHYPLELIKSSNEKMVSNDQSIPGVPDWVFEKCNVLIDPNGVFSQCQSVSHLVYTSCLLDVSSTNGDEATFCADVSFLAQMCVALPNVTNLEWRSEQLCPPQCQANAHYSSRISPCPSTCDNPYAPLFCLLPPTEGCICNDGYVNQGGICIEIEECGGCLNDVGVMVLNGTQWLTSDCTRTCTCNGNGYVSCVSTPCGKSASCVTIGTSHGCKCNEGYYGDGYSCIAQDNCSPSNDCVNDAQCITKDGGYSCLCQVGYTGQYCEQAVDYCSSSPCLYGTCVSQIGSYSCSCAFGYVGNNCDQKQNWCDSYPCTNLATCMNSDDGYQCLCRPGTSGQNCEITFSTTSIPSSTHAIDFNCMGLPNGDYIDPENPCSATYFSCSNGYTIERYCQSGLFFNPAKDACDQKINIAACNTYF